MSMGSPYREIAEVPDRDAIDPDAAPRPLASYDVSGRDGADGQHGRSGFSGATSGQHGSDGGDAGPAGAGEAAGRIRIELRADDQDRAVTMRGELTAPNGTRTPIATTAILDDAGMIVLRAAGGAGGTGGTGGRGGDGARGSDGSDATRYSSGDDGGNGGNGGDGGDGTSGGPGGAGGRIVVAVDDADTPLLMLIEVDVAGGGGGAAGHNGAGGDGGRGGDGGDSYSWTETEHYTDSHGHSQTRSHTHRNSGGSDGSPGVHGFPGRATLRPGASGEDGVFSIEVTADGEVTSYPSRYDLRLVAFAHDTPNADYVYEPDELVRVTGIEVQNTGGMPTPRHDELRLELVAGGWVRPEPAALTCAPGLAPGDTYRVPGELTFRIASHTPDAPGPPLEVEESIVHRAMLPSVGRGFDRYQDAAAVDAGRFVIRYPARASEISNLRSLVAGESTRVRCTIVNQSRLALGAASATGRVVRLVIATAADSELGDDHVRFRDPAGGDHAPSAGWTHELPTIAPGESITVELVVAIAAGAPDYRRYAAAVTLELGRLDAPARAVPIQRRAFDIRVARPFAVSEADVLLVTNHRTTREELEAWEAVAQRLGFALAVWDLTREGHLDLEAPRADGVALATWFAGKAIVVLDNEIDGPDGPIQPHVLLAPDQALRAAQAGIDLLFVGTGPGRRRILVPRPSAARTTAPVHRRYWLRFWAMPDEAWLAAQARAASAALCRTQPERRHVVVYRHAPRVVSRFLWIKTWEAGVIETVRTLDAAAGAIVRAEVDDAALHAPAYAASPEATTALLVMFDFGENLARLRAQLTRIDADAAAIDTVADVVLLDLVEELVAVSAPGAGTPKHLDAALPRLAQLADSKLTVDYDSPAGQAVIRLAGRLRFFADSQVRWFERVPPMVWTRVRPAVRRRVHAAVDRCLAGAFGEDQVTQTRADAIVVAEALDAAYRKADKDSLVPPRSAWALELARAPLATRGVISDVEELPPDERVMSGAAYDQLDAAGADEAEVRAALVETARRQQRELAG
jgi:hypothetical protein